MKHVDFLIPLSAILSKDKPAPKRLEEAQDFISPFVLHDPDILNSSTVENSKKDEIFSYCREIICRYAYLTAVECVGDANSESVMSWLDRSLSSLFTFCCFDDQKLFIGFFKAGSLGDRFLISPVSEISHLLFLFDSPTLDTAFDLFEYELQRAREVVEKVKAYGSQQHESMRELALELGFNLPDNRRFVLNKINMKTDIHETFENLNADEVKKIFSQIVEPFFVLHPSKSKGSSTEIPNLPERLFFISKKSELRELGYRDFRGDRAGLEMCMYLFQCAAEKNKGDPSILKFDGVPNYSRNPKLVGTHKSKTLTGLKALLPGEEIIFKIPSGRNLNVLDVPQAEFYLPFTIVSVSFSK